MGYHTDHIQQLEDEIDALKTDLAHEVNTLIESRDYWRETFEGFYNAIHRASLIDDDGQAIDKILITLLNYKNDIQQQ